MDNSSDDWAKETEHRLKLENQVNNLLRKARAGNRANSDLLHDILLAYIDHNTPGWPSALKFFLRDSLRDLKDGIPGWKAFYLPKPKRGRPLEKNKKFTIANAVLKQYIDNPNISEIQASQNAAENLKSGFKVHDRYHPDGFTIEKIKDESVARGAYKKAKQLEAFKESPFDLIIENGLIVDFSIKDPSTN